MSDKKSEPTDSPPLAEQPNMVGWENPRRWGKVAALRKIAAQYIEQGKAVVVMRIGKDGKPKED